MRAPWLAWTLHPFAAGAMAPDLAFASPILGRAGLPILSPRASIPLGLAPCAPAARARARGRRRLRPEADGEGAAA